MDNKRSKYVVFILWIGVLIYGGLCLYLFYVQPGDFWAHKA